MNVFIIRPILRLEGSKLGSTLAAQQLAVRYWGLDDKSFPRQDKQPHMLEVFEG